MRSCLTVLLLTLVVTNRSIAADNPFESFLIGEVAEKAMIEGIAQSVKAQISKHRDAHAKANGCVDGIKVRVKADLDKKYQVGVFANPGQEFDAILRSSNGSGDVGNPDTKGGAQGLALKLLLNEDLQKKLRPLAEEQYFADKKYYLTQDFIGINRVREFFVNDVPDYIAFFQAQGAAGVAAKLAVEKAKAGGENRPEELAKIAEAVSKETFAKGNEQVQGFVFPKGKAPRLAEASLLKRLSEIRTLDPLVEEFNSMVPSLFGNDRAVKYMIKPCVDSDPTQVKIPSHVNLNDKNYLREMLKHHLSEDKTCYKLMAQFHVEGMPSVEVASSEWPTRLSEYVELASIEIPRKDSGKELMDDELCERIAFTPWHTLPEHRPIGGVQRARERIYVVIANQRNLNAGNKPLN